MLRSGELKCYLGIVVASVALVFFSLLWRVEAFPQDYTVEESFRHALFQVASLLTTAGFTTTDYVVWPTMATTTLMILMLIGGMAGSTAGGIKVSRIMIVLKGTYVKVRRLINPRYVPHVKTEGKTLEEPITNDVFSFVTLYFFIVMGVTLLLSLDPVNGSIVSVTSDAGTYAVTHGLFSNLSAAVSCMSNIGPAFEAVGPYASFAGYGVFSKLLLSFTMLLGRLEILPVLILFSPKAWKRV